MYTILLVENDKNQRLLYEQELRLEGYEVITAADGKDALEKVQKLRPDLVIIDINIPKMDGIETMGRILSKHKDIPFIINTAHINYKDKYMSLAADAYIIKSSDMTELKHKIREILREKTKKND